MRLIIAGSRDFSDYTLLEREVLRFLKRHRKDKEKVEIVSGQARGADRLGERFADRFGLEKILMPADWDKHGKKAGFLRNEEMGKVATHSIVFWDGVSNGSVHMIGVAKRNGLTHETVKV